MTTHPRTALSHNQRGLTLVEAMVAMTVAAILLSMAVPSLRDFIASNQMSTEVNNFLAAYYNARSEAAKRHQRTIVCPSTDNINCTGGVNWHQGWITVADANGDGSASSGDVLLSANPALASRFEATSGGTTQIAITSDGRTPGSNLTITFCDSDSVVDDRLVRINNAGRAYLQKGGTPGC